MTKIRIIVSINQIRLLGSNYARPKVILLNGAHCIRPSLPHRDNLCYVSKPPPRPLPLPPNLTRIFWMTPLVLGSICYVPIYRKMFLLEYIKWMNNNTCEKSSLLVLNIEAYNLTSFQCKGKTYKGLQNNVKLTLVWLTFKEEYNNFITKKTLFLWKLNTFFWTLVLVSWQASCSSLVMKLYFYKPTILKVHPPISGITTHATLSGRLDHSIISFCFMLLIQMNGAWKMVPTVGSGFELTTFQSWALCLNH